MSIHSVPLLTHVLQSRKLAHARMGYYSYTLYGTSRPQCLSILFASTTYHTWREIQEAYLEILNPCCFCVPQNGVDQYCRTALVLMSNRSKVDTAVNRLTYVAKWSSRELIAVIGVRIPFSSIPSSYLIIRSSAPLVVPKRRSTRWLYSVPSRW